MTMNVIEREDKNKMKKEKKTSKWEWKNLVKQ